MVHSIYTNNNPKMFKFVLYFHVISVHAHIILCINDIDVDYITNEIVAMVHVIIDEQFEKFILLDKFDIVQASGMKKMHQCGS